VQQVVAADGEAVTVARDHEDLELGRASLRPVARRRADRGWYGTRRCSCSTEAARAADPRDEHDVFLGMPRLGIVFCTALRMA
jgi:hypothetical protein